MKNSYFAPESTSHCLYWKQSGRVGCLEDRTDIKDGAEALKANSAPSSIMTWSIKMVCVSPSPWQGGKPASAGQWLWQDHDKPHNFLVWWSSSYSWCPNSHTSVTMTFTLHKSVCKSQFNPSLWCVNKVRFEALTFRHCGRFMNPGKFESSNILGEEKGAYKHGNRLSLHILISM